MAETDSSLSIVLLAVPEVTASTLYGMFDLFASAGRDWSLITKGVPGPSLIRTRILSADGEGFHTANGAWVQPQGTLEEAVAPDVICMPDLLVAPGENIDGRHPRETRWLRENYAAGSTLATACTGVLLLAEAGLLDDTDTTTHWAYCDALSRDYPRARVHPERALVVSGEAQRLVMAGGGTSWQDLALLLIARFLGTDEAMHMARLYLIDWHHIGQQPFAALTRPRHVDDALIGKCQVWAAQHYDEDSPVASMVKLSGLSERSFARRFSQATGMSPLEYIHTLRLEEAKQMLEGGEQAVEAIANEVGYEDASFFGRLFKRKVGLTPTQYRKRFGALRRSLLHNMKN